MQTWESEYVPIKVISHSSLLPIFCISISKCRNHQVIFIDLVFSKKSMKDFQSFKKVFVVLSLMKQVNFAISVCFVIINPMSIVSSSLFFDLFHKVSSIAVLTTYKTKFPCVFSNWLSISPSGKKLVYLNVKFLKILESPYIFVQCTTSKSVTFIYWANQPKAANVAALKLIILWQEIQILKKMHMCLSYS